MLLAASGVVLLLWVAWFLGAEIPVYVATDRARLEVGRQSYRIGPPVGGKLTQMLVETGERVRQGDLLFTLDSELVATHLHEERVRHDSAVGQLRSRRQERRERRAALNREEAAAALETREGRARIESATSAAALARRDADRAESLHREGLIPQSELDKALSDAEQREAEAEVARLTARREAEERERALNEGRSDLIQVTESIREGEGAVEVSAAAIEILRREIELRGIRSPVDGRVAEVAPLGEGTIVEQGEPLVTVIPEEGLQVIAQFSPAEALGRIRPGQPAEIRLSGFPWVEYGAPRARVASIAERSGMAQSRSISS